MLTGNTKLVTVRGEVVTYIPSTLRTKAELILRELQSFGKVIVAFSGGIDSTLMLYLAKLELQSNAIAVTANSPSLPSSELEETKKLATVLNVKQIIVQTDELDDPSYTSNPSNRCYFCKKELSQKLIVLAGKMGINTIVDGTNADDLKGHRPGAAALSEQGVRRPLADFGMTKSEVRELSRIFKLPNSEKPSNPCLSSRVEYGQEITPEKLLRIEKSEQYIRSLIDVKELRVRDHGNLARIEVGKDERSLLFDESTLDKIGEALREFGYAYVAFDVRGYRSGSMNDLLKINN
ncbi:MAG TPA: ATP-dependent sacrificial sulfur transferase LarE [Candidatus Bathyarchaeia archaeon]|nr:ATP-dependent sacrificial sulfur transferase LarE [Candidatus Bathyarchaeia archaeon]HKM78623.1 ATP-dependent sacrificial sulfur transferase LarE [Candidatus Bathyarchaeia archaeon]